jgi:succinate-semialdehyde dehydrogenase/glutarate-semialdehyde dehydrogenase
MSDADLVAASDLVVVGRVERIESVLLGTDTVLTRVAVGVESVLAGDPGATTIVVTEPGGEVAGLRAVVEGAPEWTRGERALLFLRARDENDAVALANASPYGLGASGCSRDATRAERIAARLEAGTICVNGQVRSDPRLPFGGVKQSGYGRELSEYGLREFVNVKAVVLR